MLGTQALGVPLNPNHKVEVGSLHGFHQPVGRSTHRNKPVPQFIDRLMVHRVDIDLFTHQARQEAARFKPDGMNDLVPTVHVVVHHDPRKLRIDVLEQRTAERDIHHLYTATDSD